jgi:hypothetical protein
LASYTLAFALQPRKKHGKTSVRVAASKKYRNMILLVVVYGCGTRSFTLRGKPRLGVFEKRVLRRVFGPMRDEVIKKKKNKGYSVKENIWGMWHT